jgi:protein NirF
VTPDGRYYLAGLFGEDGVALLDTWQPEKGTRRKILGNYGRGQEKLPVFKMPHLRGWSMAQGKAYLPAIGRHEVLVVDGATGRKSAASRSRGSRCSSWRGRMAGRCGSISPFPTTAGSRSSIR